MAVAELVALVSDAITIAVTQGHHTATRESDEHVAVRRDGEVPRTGEAIRENRSAETLGEGNATVVRGTARGGVGTLRALTGQQGRAEAGNETEDEKGQREPNDAVPVLAPRTPGQSNGSGL